VIVLLLLERTWGGGLTLYRNRDFASGALFPALLGSLVNAITLSLLILCAGPISGGHINPLITIGTFFGQLTTFPRTVLYVLCQTAGATAAGFLIRLALGKPHSPEIAILGCSIDPSAITLGEALVLETMSCLSLLSTAYALGLHPRYKTICGPVLGPVLIGLTLGLCTFVTGALKLGYTGASMNPARCFGLMSAQGRWDWHWVHWVGPVAAGALNAVLYCVISPSGRSRKKM
jgi:glycerol uptake facilitator-like aquaporin